MKAGRIQLSVRNHAMGGNSITPSHFCARAQLDNNGDLDLVVYEFAMIANRNDCRMVNTCFLFFDIGFKKKLIRNYL